TYAGGRGLPRGSRRCTPPPPVLVTVTLLITAVGATDAVIAGTPPAPASMTVTGCPGASGRDRPPVPNRLSTTRAGVRPWYWPLPSAVAEVSVNQPVTSTITSVRP